MSDYEEEFSPRNQRNHSLSQDSIEEYIGEFEDVSKPGQR